MKKSDLKLNAFVVLSRNTPWSGPGFKGVQWHRRTILVRITFVSQYRVEYVDSKMLEETGCPPHVEAGTLTGGGFAVDGPVVPTLMAPTKEQMAGTGTEAGYMRTVWTPG